MLASAGDWPLSSIRVASHFLVFAGHLFVSSQPQERRGRCSLQKSFVAVLCGGPSDFVQARHVIQAGDSIH